MFKGLAFEKALRRGHEVQVLTGFPNYPGGKLYEGYRHRPVMREIRDGNIVTRVWLYPSHDHNQPQKGAELPLLHGERRAPQVVS